MSPTFYGYIPNSGSGVMFVVYVAMMMFSACHIMVRILGIAVLATAVSAYYICLWLCADMQLYFVAKAGRDDFRYWLRLDGKLSWVASFVARFAVKVIVDFFIILDFHSQCNVPNFCIEWVLYSLKEVHVIQPWWLRG